MAKAVDEDDNDEDKGTEDDDEETDEWSRQSYIKNEWKLIAVWTNIDKQEAFRRVAEIMIEDFSGCGWISASVGGSNRKEYWTIWNLWIQKCEYIVCLWS